MTLLLFCRGDEAALCRRGDGVLRGMYGFFAVERAMNEAEVRAFLQEAGMRAFALGRAKAHKHVFSHLEWEMTAYPVRSDEDARALRGGARAAHTPFGALEYFPVEKIAREISLPSAFRWCLPLLQAPAPQGGAAK